MSGFLKKLKQANEMKPTTSYSALCGDNLPKKYGNLEDKENKFMQTRANVMKTSASAPTIFKTMRGKVQSVKQVQQTIADEIKRGIKFTVDQITNKLTKKSTYSALGDTPCKSAYYQTSNKNTLTSADNPCYNTPVTRSSLSAVTPNGNKSQQPSRKRKAKEDPPSQSTNPVTNAMKDLKRSRRSLRKVIKKQDKRATKTHAQSVLQTAQNRTPRKQKRLRMPSTATPTPAKLARIDTQQATIMCTPTTRQRASRYINPGVTPNSIIDYRNQKRVVRRKSSRICGLLGITNPIAYQLNTKI